MNTHRRHNASLRGWEADFDQGACVSVAQEDGKIRITPRADYSSNWIHWAVRNDRMAGSTPHFLIAKASRAEAPAANENMAVWATALDTDTWNKFDNQAVGASDIEFYNNAPFPNGTIYISFLPLYPTIRVQRKVLEWLKDARVSVLSVGQSTRRAGASNRAVPGLPFYGLKVTNTSGFTKNKAILTAHNHPNETPGGWQLEGAMSWLLGGSALAEFMLDWFEFYVYPCVNPQGVWNGFYRSCPQDATRDHNREWDDTGVLECIDAIKTSMNAETGGVIDFGIDYHQIYDDGDGSMSSPDHTAGLYAIWLAKMQALDAGFGYSDATIAESLHALWSGSYSADLAIACEYGGLNTKGITDWKTQGENSLKAATSMQAEGRWTNGPGIGSRSFNGTTDRIDWATIANLTGHALSVSFWTYIDASPTNGYFLCIHDGGDASYGIIINSSDATNKVLSLLVHGTTDMVRASANAVAATGAWTHFLITWTGAVNDYNTAHIYKNGVEVSYSAGLSQNGASETTHTGSWSLGGRIYSDTRNIDAKIAQVGVWSRVLTAGEIANLAAGYAPDLAAASDLEFYFKGNTASLDDEITSATGTADGTSLITGVGNGPGIIYG